MRIISLLLISAVVVVCSCDTEGNVDPVYQTYFIKYYGEDGNQEGVDLLVNADGSLILLGNSSSQTNPVTIPFIAKVDPFGSVQWQRQLGGQNVGGQNEKTVDVEFDNSGNLIILTNYAEGENARVKVYRLSPDGVGMDSIMVDFQEWQVGKSVTVTTDGRILITGNRKPDPDQNYELPGPDLADVTILEIDPTFQQYSIVAQFGGGEMNGAGVKLFERTGGFTLLGYSDKPRRKGAEYKLSFEAISLNPFIIGPGPRVVLGPLTETQTASSAIETFSMPQGGYLLVGTSYVNTLSSNIYLVHFYNPIDRILSGGEPTVQFNNVYPLNRRLEGISVAAAEPDDIYVLANETKENNKRDIFLLMLTGSGDVKSSNTFGALEGDDTAGAVRIMPDGRIAVFGTMELETQKKMVLIMLSQDGRFSN
jgi:hypothetical protein